MMIMLKHQLFVNNTTIMLAIFCVVFVITMTTNSVQGGWYNKCGYGTILSYLWKNQQYCANGQQNTNTVNVGSPCPKVFQYNWDGIEWHGTIIAPSLPYGTPARLIARLSIGRVLPTKYAGSIELMGPRAEVLHAMLTEQPIRYRVNFPLPHPLPLVTAITLNDRLICSGPIVSGPIVTSITLEHNLYPHNTQGQTLDSRGRLPPVNPQPFGSTDQQQNNNQFPQDNFNNQRNDDEITNPNLNNVRETIPDFNNFDIAQLQNNRSNINNNTNKMNPIEKNILNDICGTPVQITPLIANGDVTKRGSHPWLVAIFAQKTISLEFTCGGTLISSKFLITAAHCIRYGENRALNADEVVIVLGKYRIRRWTEQGTVVRDAARIILHPEYRALSGDADLAVIELAEPVTFTDTIRPVCLQGNHKSTTGSLVGVEAIIVGWGRDETGLKVTPEPRQVRVKIVSQEDCLRSRLEFRYITSNRTLCAGGITPGSGPCSGDSGGGLFIKENDGKWYLRGVISMSLADPTTKSCDLKHYSVFVDISKFIDWIIQFIN